MKKGRILVVILALLLYVFPVAAQIKPAVGRIGFTDFFVTFTGDFQKGSVAAALISASTEFTSTPIILAVHW